jgi:hypothetical protein
VLLFQNAVYSEAYHISSFHILFLQLILYTLPKPRQLFADLTAEACVQFQYSSYRIFCGLNVTGAGFF